MSKNDYPVLCGGTFFALLLNAIKNRTSKRANAVGEKQLTVMLYSERSCAIALVKEAMPAEAALYEHIPIRPWKALEAHVMIRP